MKKETASYFLPFVIALIEGKQLQTKWKIGNKKAYWEDTDSIDTYGDYKNLRIKPKPKTEQ